MTVTLTAEQEQLIAKQLREKIASGMGRIRRGEVMDGKTAIQNLRKKLHHRERGGQ